MPKEVRNTYGNLSRTLQTLGFTSIQHGNHVVFTHNSGRPVIILPAYKSGQAVQPIHLMMVKKQLIDVGLIEPGAFTIPSLPKSVGKPKAAAGPTLKIKS